MLLLLLNERLGSTNTLKSFASSLPLPAALDRLYQHQQAYNAKYVTDVTFTFLAVSKIAYLDTARRNNMRIELIEDLPTTPIGFA